MVLNAGKSGDGSLNGQEVQEPHVEPGPAPGDEEDPSLLAARGDGQRSQVARREHVRHNPGLV